MGLSGITCRVRIASTLARMTIAVPMATAQSLGLPDKSTPNGIWIMNAGTTTAHLMVPGE